MKLVLTADDRIGVERDGGMVNVSAAFADIRYRAAADRMPRVLAVLGDRRSRVEELAAAGEPEPLPALQAPVPRPPKLIAAVGREGEVPERERPLQDMYLKSPDSVTGPEGTVVLPSLDHPEPVFRGEAELALVVGRRAKDLPADERALAALAGYTCALDVAAVGLGRIGPSRIGGSFDTFTPLGPAIVTTDEVRDPELLQLTLSIGGDRRRPYSVGDLAYGVVEVLAYISGYMTLVPGDVILCGANGQEPSEINDGDRVEVSIERVGTLAVTVRGPERRA